MAKIFITGGTGCIGAAAVNTLLSAYSDDVESIAIASRTGDRSLLGIWLSEDLDALVDSGRIQFVSVDIGDNEALSSCLQQYGPTHIIHLGALQSPACDSDPIMGVDINTSGTVNLFRAAETISPKLERFVFASSGAVYGKRAFYPQDIISENVVLAPPNYYGVWKVAGEHLAALFHERSGIATVSLRLNTTFGPGRDRGKTSAPTVALKSIALGNEKQEAVSFRMPYQGRENYHYVEDVGAHFAGVCMMAFEGCEPFNIKGKTIEVSEFLAVAAKVANDMGLSHVDLGIEQGAAPNLFICDLDHAKVNQAFPGLPRTEIEDGIRKSLEMFCRQARAGTLKI